MEYFSILDLKKEPFSNSPDPEFFYQSRQHQACLQKLELALRLRRGLNVVIGEVGTGKTTLCRQLIRSFTGSDEVETYLILDPDFTSPTEFLETVAKNFNGRLPSSQLNDWQLKEFIKNTLFRKGVDQGKTVILIVDEGQKLPTFCLELLREFLNYETNEHKLLQIVIFAQKEFENTISSYANFTDRINLYHYLKPMNFADTRRMIKFRLEKSSDRYREYRFFSFPALLLIYWITRGYPRKIINLCHRCILTMIIQNRTVVDLLLVRTCIQRVFPKRVQRTRKYGFITTAGLVAGAVLAIIYFAPARQLTQKVAGVASGVFRSEISPARQPEVDRHPPATGPESVSLPAKAEQAIARKMIPAIPDPMPGQTTMLAAAPDITEVHNIKPPSAPLYSRSLGQVTVKHNQTLSGLIESVYGKFNSKYFRAIIMANPQIEDPDVVKVGQTIELPAIPAAFGTTAPNGWWVKVAQEDNIEAALGLQQRLTGRKAVVRLVPYWTSVEGLQFALFMDRFFTDRQDADRYVKQLPPKMATKARIVSFWTKDTVYFSDPFFGRKPA